MLILEISRVNISFLSFNLAFAPDPFIIIPKYQLVFGVVMNITSNFLFKYRKLYQLSYLKPIDES